MRRLLYIFVLSLLCSNVFGFEFIGTINGEVLGDQYGESFCQLDINGDGFYDLAVAASASDENGISSGKVYIYFGGATLDTIPDLELHGDASSFFGKSLSSAGDFNNDTFEDLLVGAPFYDLPATSAGAVYLFYGGVSPDNTVDHIFTGENNSDYFGITVCGTGDFNSDTFDDFAVGAYKADWGAYSDAGMVSLYYGGVAPDFNRDKTLVGSSDGERFGYSLAAGDFTGDGIDDIAVGAYSYDAEFLNMGNIYLFNGGISPDTLHDLTITGDSAGYKFGWELTSGLVNSDIYDDLISGTDTYPVDTFDAGKVFIYHGGPAFDNIEDDSYLNNRTAHDYFGFSVNSGVDYNLDGDEDIIVGSPGYDDAGAAFLFDGSGAIVLDSIFGGTQTDEGAGHDIILWKYNSNETAIIVGAPYYDQSRGRIYIYKYGQSQSEICGDVNASGTVNILDVTYLIAYLYQDGPAPNPLNMADVNSSGTINILDITYLISYLYMGGPEPDCP
jgi:hypothetical protein